MGANQTALEPTLEKTDQSLTGELLCIDIKDIDLYDKNPRRGQNPAYDRIKASILASGLDQPLIITRRPNEERFVVHAGGNTRLKILKELHAVSRDPAFALINCIYVRWNNESAVLLAHLRENDLRGELTFIDKAVAICALEDLVAEETGSETLSVRNLRQVLCDRGYRISIGMISYMHYAVNVLLPMMPVALTDGLGRSQIEVIRQLQRVARDTWVSREIGSGQEFDGIFSELCRRHDMPDWQIEPLRRAVETEIAEAADTSIHLIRMELELAAAGHSIVNHMPPHDSQREECSTVKEPEEPASEVSSASSGGQLARLTIEAPGDVQTVSIASPSQGEGNEFDALRCRAYQLARSLAQRHGLADLVVPLSDAGLGFAVKDIPPPTVIETIDDDLRATVCTMWWQLLAFSEIMAAPQSTITEILDENSELRAVALNGNVHLLFEKIWIIDPANFADRFWNRLSQQDWQEWLHLAQTYRELHKLSLQEEQPLWEIAP